MIVGCYYKDGRVLVSPIDQAAEKMGVSKYTLKAALEGKHVLRGVTIVQLPNGSTLRSADKSYKIK